MSCLYICAFLINKIIQGSMKSKKVTESAFDKATVLVNKTLESPLYLCHIKNNKKGKSVIKAIETLLGQPVWKRGRNSDRLSFVGTETRSYSVSNDRVYVADLKPDQSTSFAIYAQKSTDDAKIALIRSLVVDIADTVIEV